MNPYLNQKQKISFNWNNFLDGTQRTLNIINQAIPIFYQIKPIITNTKTLFKIVNVMNNKENTSTDTKQNISNVFYT